MPPDEGTTPEAGQGPTKDEGKPQDQGPAGAGTNGDDQGGAGKPDAGATDEPFDEGRARALIEKLRPFEKQAGRLQRDLEAAQTKIREFEERDMTEADKAKRRLADLEAERDDLRRQVQETRLQGTIEDAAASADPPAIRPRAVWKMIDMASIEYDEDGQPTKKSIKAALEDVRKEAPELFQGGRPSGSGDGGPRGDGATGASMNDLIRQRAGRT